MSPKILYVNGDSNSAAAEAVNDYAFAADSSQADIRALGRAPHPDNVAVSYGKVLADMLGLELVLGAESASSNDRILRTSKKDILALRPEIVIIGWTSWERTEIFHDDTWWQLSAQDPARDWPMAVKQYHRDYYANLDIRTKVAAWHDKIFEFHNELLSLGQKHLFFNCYDHLDVPGDSTGVRNWHNCYISPYSNREGFYHWLIAMGYDPVKQGSFHHSAAAHSTWARRLAHYLCF